MARCARASSAIVGITLPRSIFSSSSSAARGSSCISSCALAKVAAESPFLNSLSILSIASLRSSFVFASPTIEATRCVLRVK